MSDRLYRLSDAERLQLDEDLLGWVDDGAPCRVRRVVLGVEGLDDVTASGFRITYLRERHILLARWVRFGREREVLGTTHLPVGLGP